MKNSRARQPPLRYKGKNREKVLTIENELFQLILLIVLGLFALEMLVKA